MQTSTPPHISSDEITLYANGTITEYERARIDAHLIRCQQCTCVLEVGLTVHTNAVVSTDCSHMKVDSMRKLRIGVSMSESGQFAALVRHVARCQQHCG